jgi:hypothetical protein
MAERVPNVNAESEPDTPGEVFFEINADIPMMEPRSTTKKRGRIMHDRRTGAKE